MFYENRPKIRLKKSNTEKAVEYMTFGLLMLSALYTIYHYDNLPDNVPIHFNHKGEVDRYDSKDSIWGLHIIGFVLIYLMYHLSKFPHIFNYPQKITEENAEKFYNDAVKMIRYTNICLALLFVLINYEIVQLALNDKLTSLPVITGLIIVIIVLITVAPFIYLVKYLKKT